MIDYLPKRTAWYWAYGVKEGRVLLVQCHGSDEALWERERMKGSDCTTVGSISARQVTERAVRSAMACRNWTVETVRRGTFVA